MNRETWKPKVGDKVMVVGHPSLSGIGEISSQFGLQPEWFWISDNRVHIRNLDPVLEDERKGAPRPPIQEGDRVRVMYDGTIERLKDHRLYVAAPLHYLTDIRVHQIERRKQDLGREARKS